MRPFLLFGAATFAALLVTPMSRASEPISSPSPATADSASRDTTTVVSPAGNAEFPSSASGRVFLSKPEDVSIEGDSSEFGRGPEAEMWLNAIRGGFSRADYRYFLFRLPSLAGQGGVDIVFFNDDAKGFFVPVDIAPADPGHGAFTLYREAGGGESYKSKSTLRGVVTAVPGSPRITISLDYTSKLSMFIPAGQRHWSSRMIFTEVTLPNKTLEAAREISGTITNKRKPNQAPEPTPGSVTPRA